MRRRVLHLLKNTRMFARPYKKRAQPKEMSRRGSIVNMGQRTSRGDSKIKVNSTAKATRNRRKLKPNSTSRRRGSHFGLYSSGDAYNSELSRASGTTESKSEILEHMMPDQRDVSASPTDANSPLPQSTGKERPASRLRAGPIPKSHRGSILNISDRLAGYPPGVEFLSKDASHASSRRRVDSSTTSQRRGTYFGLYDAAKAKPNMINSDVGGGGVDDESTEPDGSDGAGIPNLAALAAAPLDEVVQSESFEPGSFLGDNPAAVPSPVHPTETTADTSALVEVVNHLRRGILDVESQATAAIHSAQGRHDKVCVWRHISKTILELLIPPPPPQHTARMNFSFYCYDAPLSGVDPSSLKHVHATHANMRPTHHVHVVTPIIHSKLV